MSGVKFKAKIKIEDDGLRWKVVMIRNRMRVELASDIPSRTEAIVRAKHIAEDMRSEGHDVFVKIPQLLDGRGRKRKEPLPRHRR